MLISVDAKKWINFKHSFPAINLTELRIEEKFLKMNKYSVITAVSFPNLHSLLLPWWHEVKITSVVQQKSTVLSLPCTKVLEFGQWDVSVSHEGHFWPVTSKRTVLPPTSAFLPSW